MLEPGDICICIKNFSSNLSGELLLFENDIVQIHKIIDKLWLEGTSAGLVGRFPASIVVTMEVPQHSDNLPLFVAAADFEPVQEGDLRLRRGTFVVGRNEIDSDWWFGESGGKVGVFPLNHVWKIKKELMKSFTLQNVVNMKGKVLTSTRAQLPEEVDLYAGDNVIITGIIDEDWYRGISCGQRGIFPSSCIELSKDASIAFEDSNNLINHNIPKSIIDDNFINESPGNVAENEVTSATMAVVSRPADKDFFEPGITTLNSNAVDNSWRNITTTDVDALFEDDYFKQNMPSMYKPSVLSNKEVISGLLLENQGIKNDCDMGSSLNVLEDLNSLVTLSAKVDEYFNNDVSGDNNIINKETLQDLLEIDFAGMYTEDNTGICPYGRAIFSFSAQYTNELSFKKGDIIHLIKHIDSHWTVGNLGNAKGIFPTSYIDIIVDCPYKAEENFARRPAYSSQESFVGHALVCYDFEAVNVEEVSIQKGDIVVIRDYINDEWVNVQKDEGNCGIVPLNHLQLSEETGNKICEHTSIFSPKNSKRYYDKSDFSNKKILDIDNALSLNLNSLKISSSNDKPLNTHSCSEFDSQIDNKELSSFSKPELPLEFAASKLQDNKNKETGKVTLASSNDENKLISEHCGSSSDQVPKSVISQPEKGTKKVQTSTSINKETYLDKLSLQHAVSISSKKNVSAASEEKVCQNSAFPEDVSSISENTCTEDEAFAFAELAPQRPAPPPPLDNVDTDQDGEACSLHTNGLSKGNLNDTSISEPQLDNRQVNNARGEAEDSKVLKMLILRRESVRELVTTEYEYIHDLEALMQVVKVGSKKKEAASVDLKVLLGNIYEVIIFAKKFVALLDTVSYEKDYSMAIGPVFIDVAEEMCDVYKVYSSNNSISVGQLLKKYSEGGETEVFLNWILQELRQHKINLLDMQAVLIKPIQRVLKYPLFIDHLVHNTPPSHPDFKNLEEARKKLLNVAKEINEYTKRLDLVSKYRSGSSHSFGEIIHRVTMRSVAKKGSRFKTRISATLGLINQTRDLQFEEEETQFHSIVKATLAVCEQGEKLVLNIKARHSAELGIIESFVATLLSDIQNSNVKAVDRICEETCARLLPMFEKIVLSRVIGPAKALGSMFKAPERLIQKRYDKLLDYDTAQHRLDKNRDPTRTRILEEELSVAKGVYEALNKQLLLDLPILNRRSIDVLQMAMQSLIAARMNLEGHVAKQYLDLAQFSEFSFQNNPDYVENFKSVCVTHTNAFKKLAFLPPDFVLKSPKFGRRKSSFRSLGRESKRKISSEKIVPAGKTLIEIYQESNLFVVTNNYKAVNSLDLDLKARTLVGVIKTKDPLGNNERWFVDDGERKGFAPVSYLKRYSPSTSFRDDISSAGNVSQQYMEQRRQSHTSNLSQTSLTHQRGPSTSSEYGTSSSHSHTPSVPEVLNKANMIVNLPPVPTRVSQASDNEDILRISSNSPVETPPRYEDLFPHSSETRDSQKSVPHRYDYPPEEEDDDSTQIPGNENIYAEIEQVDRLPGPRCSTNNEGEEPIYEVILENSSEQQTKAIDCALVQPESDEQQFFYYALYNFGGSDENQLSLYEGQVVLLLFAQGSEWWFVEDRNGKRGYVPASYLSRYS